MTPVVLSPDPSGDSYSLLQGAITNYINGTGGRIILSPGTYLISQPLIAASIVNGEYVQISLDMEGPTLAKNTPAQYLATIVPSYNNTFVLGIQQGKGCTIKNIAFSGPFTFPSSLSQTEIDVLPFSGWTDGSTSINRTCPFSGIVIDPFSDPVNFDGVTYQMYAGLSAWYISGMSQSGSTAVQIIGCTFNGFAVGIMVTPSDQQNGEEIDVIDCSVQNCISAYGYSQAQSKANTITRMQVWGGVHSIIDGGHWGFSHGDGATCPMVDVMNIAGINHQLIYGASYTFPVSIKRVYAEGLFKIGFSGGTAGTCFDSCQFDMQCGPGVPLPDFWYFGDNTTWIGCMIRNYGYPTQRLVFNNQNNLFIGGSFGAEPVLAPLQQGNVEWVAILQNVAIYYTGMVLNASTGYDFSGIKHNITLTIGEGYTGTYSGAIDEEVGDLILTEGFYEDELTAYTGMCLPVGYVSSVSGGIVQLTNIGMGMTNGEALTVRAAHFKAGFKP